MVTTVCVCDCVYRLPRTGHSRPGSQGPNGVAESQHGNALVVDARRKHGCRYPHLLALVPPPPGRILLPRLVLLATALQIIIIF
jgi:hypothetical protein